MPVDLLPLKTVRNPRDLGGYVGYAGRKIKKKTPAQDRDRGQIEPGGRGFSARLWGQDDY